MCMLCWFTRMGLNAYALLVYQSGDECVCLIDLPERGLNVYALLIYQRGAECVYLIDFT